MYFVSNEGFSEKLNTVVIDNHEKSATLLLTYLPQKQGRGLRHPLEKQIEAVITLHKENKQGINKQSFNRI